MAELSPPGSVYSRTDAGLPATPGGSRRDRDRVVGMTVHWTTGRALGVTDTAAWWKRIYDYHTGHNRWADVGYAYGVDRFGNVFTGRGRFRTLAHAAGYNTDWLGVAYLGGHDDDITPKGKAALLALWDWLRGDGGMTAMARRNGHRDLGQTACPGGRLHRWVHAGMPAPNLDSDPEPEDKQPDGAGQPDYVVAVVADNDIDEGAARVLGHAYRWRYLRAPRDLEHVTVGTAVRVGAARALDGPWQDVHDVGGPDRDATTRAVLERIRADQGDSRNVT